MADPKKVYYISFTLSTFCFLGFCISFYSYMIELKAEMYPGYQALCDISENVSCTKAFTSGYGKGFGIIGKILGEKSPLNLPNSIYGMVFYTLFFFANMLENRGALMSMVVLGVLSNLMSIYLGYILAFILYDLCILCVSTYIINATLLLFSLYKRHVLTAEVVHKKQS